MTNIGHQHHLSGLYIITDKQLIGGARLIPAVSAALEGGARIVQYRDKTNEKNRRRDEATALLELCRQAGVPLIINDDVELAASVGADGVHLGRLDCKLSDARTVLGKEAIIGISCYNDPARAKATDADYAAFGRFFPSSTKPEAGQAALSVLKVARESLSMPIAAIGGITCQNGKTLRDAGADMLAVAAGVFGEKDIRDAARRLATLYPRN